MEGDCVTIDSDEDDHETGFRNYNSPRHRSRSRTGPEFCEGARFGQSRHPEHNLSQPHARGSREENYVDRNSRQDYFRSRERDRHREREYDRFLRRDHHDNIHDRRRNCLHDKYDHMHNKRKRSASRESSVKFMRSSSRNSNRSASSDGPKSFEEMARGILAGTLRDDDTPPAPPAVQFASFGRSVSPTPPMPMFGAPAPPSHAHSEFDLLRLREMGSLPAAATPPASAPHPIMADTQRQQEDMCSRVAEALAHTDQRPSRVLRLERPVGSLELSQIYASICPQPCDHLECKKFPSCLLFPMVKDHGGIVGGCVDLEFQSESSAAVFKRVLSGHSISSHHVPASSRVLDTTATTRAVKAEDKAGIPKRIFKETYLLCSVAVDVISSSCVDHGTVSAPVKICIYSGDSQYSSVSDETSLLFLKRKCALCRPRLRDEGAGAAPADAAAPWAGGQAGAGAARQQPAAGRQAGAGHPPLPPGPGPHRHHRGSVQTPQPVQFSQSLRQNCFLIQNLEPSRRFVKMD